MLNGGNKNSNIWGQRDLLPRENVEIEPYLNIEGGSYQIFLLEFQMIKVQNAQVDRLHNASKSHVIVHAISLKQWKRTDNPSIWLNLLNGVEQRKITGVRLHKDVPLCNIVISPKSYSGRL